LPNTTFLLHRLKLYLYDMPIRFLANSSWPCHVVDNNSSQSRFTIVQCTVQYFFKWVITPIRDFQKFYFQLLLLIIITCVVEGVETYKIKAENTQKCENSLNRVRTFCFFKCDDIENLEYYADFKYVNLFRNKMHPKKSFGRITVLRKQLHTLQKSFIWL
jgi:hypothetical protein